MLAVEAFVEKPDAATATPATFQENYLWNSGKLHVSRADVMLDGDRKASAGDGRSRA